MAAITVNVKQQDKEMFGGLCERMGMNVSTAINVFIKTVNRSKKIPFEVGTGEEPTVFASAAPAQTEGNAQ